MWAMNLLAEGIKTGVKVAWRYAMAVKGSKPVAAAPFDGVAEAIMLENMAADDGTDEEEGEESGSETRGEENDI